MKDKIGRKSVENLVVQVALKHFPLQGPCVHEPQRSFKPYLRRAEGATQIEQEAGFQGHQKVDI